MATDFKIIGGTPKSGAPLCNTCKYASRVRGQNCEDVTICKKGLFDVGPGIWKKHGEKSYISARLYGEVPFAVSECTEYQPSNQPSLYEMEEIAWQITARKRGSAGFADGQTDELITEITPPAKKGPNAPKF